MQAVFAAVKGKRNGEESRRRAGVIHIEFGLFGGRETSVDDYAVGKRGARYAERAQARKHGARIFAEIAAEQRYFFARKGGKHERAVQKTFRCGHAHRLQGSVRRVFFKSKAHAVIITYSGELVKKSQTRRQNACFFL